ncbi:hypothetical protein NP493_383g01031 [Ridgeia piscesae]|uniref:Uncharacterized protein n=1 Tax=Ridgeia piscesae TaxID=27915 RepID=A0AAD9NVT3_RIDPI|nr:hypothetical protein NP493_383g01031 [Ridgeia piscesae]
MNKNVTFSLHKINLSTNSLMYTRSTIVIFSNTGIYFIKLTLTDEHRMLIIMQAIRLTHPDYLIQTDDPYVTNICFKWSGTYKIPIFTCYHKSFKLYYKYLHNLRYNSLHS